MVWTNTGSGEATATPPDDPTFMTNMWGLAVNAANLGITVYVCPWNNDAPGWALPHLDRHLPQHGGPAAIARHRRGGLGYRALMTNLRMVDGPVANLPPGFDAYAGYVNRSGIGITYPR